MNPASRFDQICGAYSLSFRGCQPGQKAASQVMVSSNKGQELSALKLRLGKVEAVSKACCIRRIAQYIRNVAFESCQGNTWVEVVYVA